jgi:hypothetical protein
MTVQALAGLHRLDAVQVLRQAGLRARCQRKARRACSPDCNMAQSRMQQCAHHCKVLPALLPGIATHWQLSVKQALAAGVPACKIEISSTRLLLPDTRCLTRGRARADGHELDCDPEDAHRNHTWRTAARRLRPAGRERLLLLSRETAAPVWP